MSVRKAVAMPPDATARMRCPPPSRRPGVPRHKACRNGLPWRDHVATRVPAATLRIGPRAQEGRSESFGGRLELLRRRRKAGNPELHPLLRLERQLVLDLHKGPLVSTLLDLVPTHCPKTAQKVFWEGL
ncbi:hypothetical protein Taro_003267 [Colocasia esculenta]|uniref:Uncharacterized protein n=1 Tax=Colocasia esculenta TaxID=4460 RepID=A0A843TLL3_COLES|nr:hypothetical protein [Colocasia esculenta]